MRQRTAIAIGVAAAVALWAAVLLKSDTIRISDPPPGVGGLSGLAVTGDGAGFVAISDRNMLIRGEFRREDGRLAGVVVTATERLRDHAGRVLVGPWNDAEGLALTEEGAPVVSFESLPRVLRFDEEARGWPLPDLPPLDLHHANKGFEALALDAQGRAVMVSEIPLRGEETAAILRETTQGWERFGSLALDHGFSPTGADFDPDGALYVLERKIGLTGLRSRIRRIRLTGAEAMTGEVVWSPRVGHGNLEGLSLWTDTAGALRATMVADDNELPFLPGGFTEIILAKPAPAE